MKIETYPLEDHQLKLTVEFEPNQLVEAKQKAARKLANRIKIPGFRPGKAPYAVLARYIGEEAILEEGVEILVNDLYPRIIEEAKVEPYGPGKVENISSFDPLTIDFIVPLKAEIKLGDYRSIRIPYEPGTVGEEQVEEVLEDLRQRNALEEAVSRPAEEGDHLRIKLSASRFEGEIEDGEVIIPERQLSLIIAKKEENVQEEWPFQGFSRELIGLSVGERKNIVYSFPEDHPFEDLRGNTARISVEVEEVRARQLPDLDDKFAQIIGDYESLDQLKEDIRTSLRDHALESYNTEYVDRVIEQILGQAELKYPPQMVENEVDDVIHDLERRLHAQGFDLDTYLKTREIDANQLREEARPVAETRVKRSLVLYKIAEEEDIRVDSDELQTETVKTLESLSRFMPNSERKKVYSDNFIRGMAGNIYTEMRINKTLTRLRDIARGMVENELTVEPPGVESVIKSANETVEQGDAKGLLESADTDSATTNNETDI